MKKMNLKKEANLKNIKKTMKVNKIIKIMIKT